MFATDQVAALPAATCTPPIWNWEKIITRRVQSKITKLKNIEVAHGVQEVRKRSGRDQ